VAEPPLAPPPTFTDPLPNYEIPAEAFVPPQSDVPPTVESYLAAARRSARAAAAQEAERSGNLRWGSTAKAKPEKTQKTRPLVAFLVALIAIFVIVGAVLSRQNTKLMVPPQPVAQKAMPPAPDLHASSEGEAKSVAEASAQAPVHAGPANAAITAPASATPANLKPMNAAAPEPSKPTPQLAALPPQNQMNARAPLDRLTQAANGGNAKAQLIVGLKYLEHDGVPENFTEAAKWLGKAAEAGEPVAQYRLGTMFERGRGVPADVAKAIRWYQAAANQGNRKAMHNLAVAFTDGPSKNYTEASRWFLKAANLGLSDSQFNLAVLYERGLGVPQNLVDAYKWYAIAAAQGDGESKSRLNAIASQLDSEARAAAQHAADVFRPGQLDARANVAPTVGDVTRG
jgi:localization factor PodJL